MATAMMKHVARLLLSSKCKYEGIGVTKVPSTLGLSLMKRFSTQIESHSEHDNHHRQNNIRAQRTDPSEHSALDSALFYQVPKELSGQLRFDKILRPEYVARCKSFHETAIMVRHPALEVISLLKAAAQKTPAMRCVLYGEDGTGKSLSLVHIMHAAQSMGWMIVCPAQQYLWNNYFKEIARSSHKTDRIDLPLEGSEFLMVLKSMNQELFRRFGDDLLTQHDYTWSRRETTEKGTKIEKLIDFGIERTKYSCDVVGAFFKELRTSSHSWPFKTLLAMDGVNSLWGSSRIIADAERHEKLKMGQLSLAHHFRKILSSDWMNGASVVTVDKLSSPHYRRTSPLPRYLLRDLGWTALDPFIPIEVQDYTSKEITNALDYLIEKNWIQNKRYRDTHTGRQELIFLSAKNPLQLDRACRGV